MYKYNSIKTVASFIEKIKERAEYNKVELPVLEFEGTVKLHGANCSVFLQDDKVYCQSRNRILSLDNDFNNFNKFVITHYDYFYNMLKKASLLNKEKFKNNEEMVPVIFGEWCNDNRKGMGLTNLGALFCVFEVSMYEKETISYEMVEDNDNEEQTNNIQKQKINLDKNLFSQIIEKNKINVYNIHDFPKWKVKLDIKNPDISDMLEIVNQVEKECPFSKQLGSIGIGEGVVYTCITDIPALETKGIKFKIKGPKHKISNKKVAEPVDIEKLANTEEFVNMVVTENRLLQGLDYLKEFNLSMTNENIGVFLSWVVKDCLKEEKEVIEKSNLDKKMISKAIGKKAQKFYFDKINSLYTKKNKM